ncbi:squalene/phytoene synthase family protein [Bacteroidota bacterium]
MNNEINNIINSIAFEKIEKHPNILIAARFWDDKRYFAAKVCYKFMRMIDDHIDDRKAVDDAIGCMEKQILTDKVNSWIECLAKTNDNDPFIKELADTISRFKIPLELFHNFAKSMHYDINNNGFSTLKEFMDYAEGASVAPASVFVHLCSLSEENGEYKSPDFDVIKVARPCAIFSYIVHIIRDFQEDQLNNLNYFATDILERNNLLPSDLKEMANGSPVTESFRNVVKEYYNHAQDYGEQTLKELQNLKTKLSDRNLLSLYIIYNLYKQVFDRIDIKNGNFSTRELKPSPQDIKDKVMEITSGWKQT